MDSHGTLRTHGATSTHVCTRAPADTHKGGGTSSPSGSHVFPTASRSYNGAVASRRPGGRRERANERATATMQRTATPAVPEFVVLCQAGRSPATRFPVCVVLPEAMRNVCYDLEVEEDADSHSAILFSCINSFLSFDSLLLASCYFFLSAKKYSIYTRRKCTLCCWYIFIW